MLTNILYQTPCFLRFLLPNGPNSVRRRGNYGCFIYGPILVQLALVLRVRQSSPIGKQGQTISSRKLILLDHLEPCQQNCFDQQGQDYTSEVLLVQVLTIILFDN